jgi:Tfp pilus assembly PilM family ATPase/Tfp pilus assembly protein PilN
MSTRTSFELHADGCRLVDVYARPGGRGSSTTGDVRVRTFVSNIPGEDGPALTATLTQLRHDRKLRSEACVTIWGLRSSYQFLRLPPAQDADLEGLATREARKEIAPLEVDGAGACVALMVGADVQVGTHRRREVSVVAVSEADVRRRIQPITDAGFLVSRVVTPAIALTSVARSCKDVVAGTTVAYVALGSRATCVAIVRDGLLLFAREMPWGHGEVGHEPIETRLASELRRSILFFRQTFRSAVDGVVLCGDMSNMRALTAPVGDALGVPVQTLDSLTGIDAEHVPEPADSFRADVAALRLAIAAGAEPLSHANLLPAAIRKSRNARAEMTRIAAAVVAGVLVVAGWSAMARSASGGPSEITALQQRLAILEPQSVHLAELRRAFTVATLRQAALAALGSQGPRLARLLEELSRSTPDEIALTAINVQADGAHWRTTVEGLAVAQDVSGGQNAVNRLLARLADSPFVGPAAQPPSFRLVSGGTDARVGEMSDARSIPDGMSGVAFAVQFKVPK